uniref:LAGLIDADG endonuclease n=1 Tax=Chrysoporthe austroafricana TaxID=354353 RepID=A0A191MWQ7_9PEZI|nr:LAGLIDADG endonuclease [Chrysoporthe austroafricana]AMX22100.1 LAGLIDADG endonuclease [Chrysoporthe austroafricana]
MVTKSPAIITRNDKRNNSVTQSMRFKTLAMPCLNYYHDLFYKNKVKSIPRNLGDLLTARGLAGGRRDFSGLYNKLNSIPLIKWDLNSLNLFLKYLRRIL